jgi:hypothetical protein
VVAGHVVEQPRRELVPRRRARRSRCRGTDTGGQRHADQADQAGRSQAAMRFTDLILPLRVIAVVWLLAFAVAVWP